MPDAFSYPGVYVQELPAAQATIVGVSTSSTAFIDCFQRGPMNVATQVTSWSAFAKIFGGLSATSEASYGVQQFFANGGNIAWIVRIAGSATAPTSATLVLDSSDDPPIPALAVNAYSPGSWANSLEVVATSVATDATRFNLLIQQVQANSSGNITVSSEAYNNLSMNSADPLYAPAVVNAASLLVSLVDPNAASATLAGKLPALTTPTAAGIPSTAWQPLSGGGDGAAPDSAGLLGDGVSTGLYALTGIAPQIFNLLCIPAISKLGLAAAAFTTLVTTIQQFCTAQGAFFLIDPPVSGAATAATMASWIATAGIASANAAIYWPQVQIADPLARGAMRNVGPSGTVAGLYAGIDAARGIWKAPAGVDATLAGAVPVVSISDQDNGILNPLGVNVIRTFPLYGAVIWGARTLVGADALASQWKYVPVRRTARYIEQSLQQGLRWAVFEGNDEPLWAQIRASVDDFMSQLFRQGAFEGSTPQQAYLVKCDSDTTTQSDIDRGIVNILVGFAPLKPAEFVVLQIQQLAGQAS